MASNEADLLVAVMQHLDDTEFGDCIVSKVTGLQNWWNSHKVDRISARLREIREEGDELMDELRRLGMNV